MLHVQHLHKAFGQQTVLHDVSFTIPKGDIACFIGKNGAGKSTLFHIIATLLDADSGTLTWDGRCYEQEAKTIRQQIGYVPQQLAIWEDFSVAQNMRFFEQLSPIRRSDEQLRAILKSVALEEWDRKAKHLSGGMKRKLNIALSLIHQPALLLLDEPTVGIDLRSKIEIQQALLALREQFGMTMLYISHDMEEVTALADTIFNVGDDLFYTQLLQTKGIDTISLR